MARLTPARLNRYRADQARARSRHGHAVATSRAKARPVASTNPPATATAPATSAPVGAPPVASPTPLPWDSRYEQQVGGINRDRDTALTELQNEEVRAKQDFGFDDPSNPFNRLKMLEQTFQNRQRGTTNSLAAQGQLYAGAMQNAQNAVQSDFSQGRDSLRRSYDDVLAGIQSRRVGIQRSATDAIGDADRDRTQAALANRPEPDTVPTSAVPISAPAPAVVTTKPYREEAGRNRRGQPGVWHIYPDGRRVFVRK